MNKHAVTLSLATLSLVALVGSKHGVLPAGAGGTWRGSTGTAYSVHTDTLPTVQRHEYACESPYYTQGRESVSHGLWGVRYAVCVADVTVLPTIPLDDTQQAQDASTAVEPVVTVAQAESPVVVVVPEVQPEPATEDKPKHCNKGEGNGGESCDPGNNPDKGNDDED